MNTLPQLKSILNNITNFNGFHKSNPTELSEIIFYTSYLPSSSILSQRIWHLYNGPNIPLCDCGNFTKWHHVKKAYNIHCGVKCANNNSNKIKNIKQTIFNKYGTTSYAQSFINNTSLLLIQDKDWLYNQHIILEKSLAQIAMELAIDTTTVSNYCKKFNINVKFFARSSGERELETFLTDNNITSIINTKKIIPPYELDIYLPEFNIAIEYCGLYWHSSKHSRIFPGYHKQKYDKCRDKYIRLITIFEDEWIHNKELIKQKILSILGKDITSSVFARKCQVKQIDTKTKIKFFDTYHIQGNGPGSITIGLEYNKEIIACMSFIQQPNDSMILNRYATSTKVVGGFSKLLKHFQKNNKWSQIISFADLRWSQGNLYELNGFILDKILLPDYEYVDAKNIKRIHKFNFRHKNLYKILGEKYNPLLSETQNTLNSGWYKIHNCGLLRYVIKK